MRDQGVLGSTEPLAEGACVAGGVWDMLGLHVVVQIGRFCAQITIRALPQPVTEVYHFGTNFIVNV